MRRGDPAIAVAYLRVSTDEQQLGPEAQRDALERWAAGAGVVVVEWHEDRVSGAARLDARPGLLAALDALRRRRAGALAVYRRDRLARDVVLAAQVEHLVARSGAQIVTADGAGVGDGPEAALFRRIIDAFAEHERSLIQLRTRNALAVRRRRGQRFSGKAPIGERFAGDLLEDEPDERRAVDLMRRLRAGGCSLATIARILNAGRDRPRGRAWHKTTVARALARGTS